MDALIQDLRYALRSLLKSPGFSTLAVLTLALGIGANTALFSVVNAVLLRPYAYPDPDRVVRVYSTTRDGSDGNVSPADFLDWRRMQTSFGTLAAMDPASFALSGNGPAEQIQGEAVTEDFFRVLGVAPVLGRAFTADEETYGQGREVILSDAVWRTSFGADRGVVGRSVRIDGLPYRVVGVMPPGFAYPADARMWTPLAFNPARLIHHGEHFLDAVARLAPGATIEGASREMATIASRIEAANPGQNVGWSAVVRSLRDATVGDVRPALLLLLGAVGFVLLIACVNVANLLLSRATARAREHAVRAALGATAARLARGVLAESVWLGAAGGALGLGLAAWGTDAVVSLAPVGVPGIAGARVDVAVLLFAAALALGTSVLFGLLPAWRAARTWALAQRLREGGAALGGRHGRRWRQGLIVAEVALAVVLVVGSGLLLKSFLRLRAVDPGFDARHVLTFDVALTDSVPAGQRRQFYASLLERVRALPGVVSAGAILGLPLKDFGLDIMLHDVDGRVLTAQELQAIVSPQVRFVTPDFFHTMGIRVLEGRVFTDADRAGTRIVSVVSATAARRIWGAQDPIGHRYALQGSLSGDTTALGGEVIGVVQDVRDVSLAESGRPWVYVVYDQFPIEAMSIVVRSTGDPNALVGPARAALATVARDVPMYHVRTMGEWVSGSMTVRRFYATLIALFGALALGLAAVGVYGVLSQSVGERTREIGLRIALGAAPGDVAGLMVRQGLQPAGLGLGIGLALALAITVALARVLTPMLYQVTPTDVGTYATVTAFILAVALLAAWVPAHRAARLDPLEALRTE